MTALLLALGASAAYGGADFLGGLAARRATTLAVVAISQVVGLVALLPMLGAIGGVPDRSSLGWGSAAGIVGGAGIALLYGALARGQMSIVAPVAAVSGLCVPVAVGLLLGDRPGVAPLIGVALAVGAVVLISRGNASGPSQPGGAEDGRSRPHAPIAQALGAGVAIGAFYVCLQRTQATAGLWPLVASRAVSSGAFAMFALVCGRSLQLPPGTRGLVVAGGVADVAANALYLLAVRQGMLSVVATLASLYPAATVLLARLVLRERLRRAQWLGLGVAACAIVLIAGAV